MESKPGFAWRTRRLLFIVEHLIESQYGVEVDEPDEYLVPIVTATKWTPPSNAARFESRAVLVHNHDVGPDGPTPLVRSLVWRRWEDGERSRLGEVEWPDVQVTYFRVPHSELERLDQQVREVEASVGLFHETPVGIFLEERYQRVEAEEDQIGETVGRDWFIRRLDLGGIRVSALLALADRRFEEDWDNFWSYLDGLLTLGGRVTGVQEHYWVDPRAYAEFLKAALR